LRLPSHLTTKDTLPVLEGALVTVECADKNLLLTGSAILTCGSGPNPAFNNPPTCNPAPSEPFSKSFEIDIE